MANRESYRQQQQNEFEVIQSIYGNDVKDLRGNSDVWRPLDIIITLLPEQGSSGGHEVYAKTCLHIICPSKYPKISPKITLEDTKGLSDKQKNELLTELINLCDQKKGEVVIYDLTQVVQQFLHKHNTRPSGSFYDQMLIEKYKRDADLMQERAQRLSQEQQVIRDEVFKRKELLRKEDRWNRDGRRDDANSVEISDNARDRIHPNNCDLHLNIENLYFPSVGRKVQRGCCLGHSQNGSIAYSGIDFETGRLLYLTEWNIKYAQFESKCTINCKNEPSRCDGKQKTITKMSAAVKFTIK